MLVKASLGDIKYNVGNAYGLGLTFQGEKYDTAIWAAGNCLIVARKEAELFTIVTLHHFRQVPPDDEAIAAWNHICARWEEMEWVTNAEYVDSIESFTDWAEVKAREAVASKTAEEAANEFWSWIKVNQPAELSVDSGSQDAVMTLSDVEIITIPLSLERLDSMTIDAIPGGVHYAREMINSSTVVYHLSFSADGENGPIRYSDIGLIKLFKSGDRETILSLKNARAIVDEKHIEVERACQGMFLKRIAILLESGSDDQAEVKKTNAGNGQDLPAQTERKAILDAINRASKKTHGMVPKWKLIRDELSYTDFAKDKEAPSVPTLRSKIRAMWNDETARDEISARGLDDVIEALATRKRK